MECTMNRISRICTATLAFIAIVLTSMSTATAASPGRLTVADAWARATAPGSTVAAVYLVVDNPGRRSDRLLRASTPRAARVEFHSTIRDVDVVRMQRVEPVHVEAARKLTMAPGGLHAMLLDLKSPLRAGERFPLTLTFERSGQQSVLVRVVAPESVGGAHDHH
jgi:periplasmic copper chaperone A